MTLIASGLKHYGVFRRTFRFVPGVGIRINARSSGCCNPCGTDGQSSTKPPRIIYKPYLAPCPTSHDAKNMALRRPMSPHLQIHAPTLPAMTSILQRITGTIVAFYALGLAAGALFLPCGIDTYITLIQGLNLPDALVMAIKFLIGWPFAYHYLCGARFICFNFGKLLSVPAVYQSGWIAIGLSIIGAAAFSVFS